MGDMVRAKSRKAEAVIRRLIVVEGRSYVDAVRRAEEEAEAAAAPYREAASVIRSWLAPAPTKEEESNG